jgi:hypothetical protein
LSREAALPIFLEAQYEKIAAEEANKVIVFSDRDAERIDKIAQRRVDRIEQVLSTNIAPLRSINAPISSDEEGNALSPADVISDYEDEDFSFAFTVGRPFLPVEKLFAMISGDIQANRDPRKATLAGIPPLWQDYLIARATSETPSKGTGRSRRVSHKQAMDTLKAEARKNNYTVEVPRLPSRLRMDLGITMNDSDFWKALFVFGEAPDKPKSPGESYDLLAQATAMLKEDKPLSAFLNNPKRMALLRAARRNTGQPELRSRAALFRGVCPITGETFQKGTVIYKHPKHGWCTQAGLRALGLRPS